MEHVNEIITVVIKLKNRPCYTQPIERYKKLVKEASKNFCELAKRDGLIRGGLSFKRRMPNFGEKVNTPELTGFFTVLTLNSRY